jgi:hypothetical protein
MYGFETNAMSLTETRDINNVPATAGKFEALTCATPECEHTEWHACDLDGLTELATDRKAGVRLINCEADSPYR